MREFENMRSEMDRFWESFFVGKPRKRVHEEGHWLPSVDVSETKNDVVVKVELPGMNPKDLDISLSDGSIVIKGEKKQEKEQKEENYHMVERSYGAFSRSVRLLQEMQGDKIVAKCKDGVLKITLPKSEKAKAKEIKIKAE